MLLGFKTELKLNDRQRTQLACALWSSTSCLELGIVANQKHSRITKLIQMKNSSFPQLLTCTNC